MKNDAKKSTVAAQNAAESNETAVTTAASPSAAISASVSVNEDPDTGPRFRVSVGQVYRDTRPEAYEAVLSNLRKTRKRERNFSKDEPQHVHVRVLGVYGRRVAVISVEDPTAWVQIVRGTFVREMLDTGSWMPVSHEPVASVRLGDRITDVQRRRRNENMAAIQPIIALGDRMFDDEALSKALIAATASKGCDPATMQRMVRRYFQGGMTAAAVATRWPRGVAGADGRNRRVLCKAEVRGGRVKPKFGKPREDGKESFRATEFDVAKMVAGAKKYYHTPLGGNWTRAWLLMIADSYVAIDTRKSNKKAKADLEKQHGPDTYPSFAQFRYWAKTDHLIVQRLKQRHGINKFNLEFRPLSDRTENKLTGPGELFQIDATRIDVVCVHLISRRPIGRLTLYLVVDGWSHMIVGFYLTTGNPGYNAAVLALLSCAMNKVTLCAQHGREITNDQWPVECLPAGVRGDSELASLAHHRLAEQGLFQLEIAPAYRADLKGLVESMFAAANKTTIHHLPGRSDGVRYRCEGNPDDHAVLDANQLTGIIIDWILQENSRVLKDYTLTPDMISAGLTAVTPLSLWNWGIENRTGALRVHDMEMLKRLCLPRKKARITRRGLEHEGLFYRPKDNAIPEFETWTVQASQSPREEEITYNPARVDEVWLHCGERMVEMTLAKESATYEGWTLADLEAFRDEQRADMRAMIEANIREKALLEMRKLETVKTGTRMTEAARGPLAERRKEKRNKVADRDSETKRLKGHPGVRLPVDHPAGEVAAMLAARESELALQLQAVREQQAALDVATQSPTLNSENS